MCVALVATCILVVVGCSNEAKAANTDHEESETAQLKSIQFPEDWHLWKTKHEKVYESPKHELSRHLVWLSNKKYIEEHNKHADVLGYGLEMNQFGDLVCLHDSQLCCWLDNIIIS